MLRKQNQIEKLTNSSLESLAENDDTFMKLKTYTRIRLKGCIYVTDSLLGYISEPLGFVQSINFNIPYQAIFYFRDFQDRKKKMASSFVMLCNPSEMLNFSLSPQTVRIHRIKKDQGTPSYTTEVNQSLV